LVLSIPQAGCSSAGGSATRAWGGSGGGAVGYSYGVGGTGAGGDPC